MGETAEPAAKRRVVLKDGPDGGLYRVSVEQDAKGFDLLEAATPGLNNRERARVTLRKADGAVLDLRKPVPADADDFGESAVVVEVAPAAAAAAAAPSVLDQLAGCVMKPAIEQYGMYLGHADLTLRDREEALRVLAEAAVRSVGATADNPRHLVVFAGPSGSGKTRGGYEGSAMWDHAGGREALEEALKGKPEEVAGKLCGLRGPGRVRGDSVLTLYIDLNNGLQYHSGIDKLDANVRLGARLAARALNAGLGSMLPFPPEQLQVDNVLAAILRGQLASRRSTAPLLLVVHVDEWQLYMARLVKTGRIVEDAVEDVKAMFSALNSFAFDPPTELKGKFVLLPILSGTPVLGGVHLETTERMKRVDAPLPPLSEPAALGLATEVFEKQGFVDDVRRMLASVPARVGLSDTGYFPRLLCRLCDHAAVSATWNKTSGNASPLWSIKWAECAQEAARDLPTRVDYRLPVLALARRAVAMRDEEGREVEHGIARVVRDADQRGLIGLQRAPRALGDQVLVFVVLPLMLLRRWCTGSDFEPTLLRPVEVAWTWREFERLFAHFTAARLRALRFGEGDCVVALQEVLTGSRGAAALLSRRVRIRGERQVFVEEKKFMVKTTDKPAKTTRVQARPNQTAPVVEKDLSEGVFLAAVGNALFDMRFSLEMESAGQYLHVLVQDKHAEMADGCVTTSAIADWYNMAHVATENWRSGGDEAAVVYFTNRQLSDPAALNDAFFEDRPHLLVVTRAELSDALTPALAGRGLIPQNPRLS